MRKWWKDLTWNKKYAYKTWFIYFLTSSLLIFLIVWFSVK